MKSDCRQAVCTRYSNSLFSVNLLLSPQETPLKPHRGKHYTTVFLQADFAVEEEKKADFTRLQSWLCTSPTGFKGFKLWRSHIQAWSLLSLSNSSASSYFTSRSPHGGTVNKPWASLHPDASFLTERKTAARQTAVSTGGKRKQPSSEKYITTSIPSEAAFCTLVIRGFSCMELTHAWILHDAMKACLLRFGDTRKKESLFDPIYFTSMFWRQPLTYL